MASLMIFHRVEKFNLIVPLITIGNCQIDWLQWKIPDRMAHNIKLYPFITQAERSAIYTDLQRFLRCLLSARDWKAATDGGGGGAAGL